MRFRIQKKINKKYKLFKICHIRMLKKFVQNLIVKKLLFFRCRVLIFLFCI